MLTIQWWLTDGLTVLFTGVITLFTVLLWKVSRTQVQMTRTIERAYVAMSHHPPGADFGYGFVVTSTEKPADHRELTVRLEVRNHGHTPARVTDVSLRHFIGTALPEGPEYLAGPPVRGFLVKDGALTVTRRFAVLQKYWATLAAGSSLWIYGYVD